MMVIRFNSIIKMIVYILRVDTKISIIYNLRKGVTRIATVNPSKSFRSIQLFNE